MENYVFNENFKYLKIEKMFDLKELIQNKDFEEYKN